MAKAKQLILLVLEYEINAGHFLYLRKALGFEDHDLGHVAPFRHSALRLVCSLRAFVSI